ncbi:hypothetical protein BBK36DRAFT_1160739 [Trichoderma citrinoviride]|uniref:Uncharacterized protein n=1 Tax=Trichoderma citrinoviride TaxID=58853 RepID=A0A2T4B5G9_9HYPO|nr:hypothetical protein BBK36DRAFT_1160739 [Trichoderma citrinoviride]PTB64576.1 hypothetical protein BBK36DRAFT_1160739 [Trichoderma citrinoviride]
MKKFTFSRPARKKPQEPQPPAIPSTMPMSKAHKILGSTPLNIDAPLHDPKLPTVSVGMYDNKALDEPDMNMPGERRRNERQPSPSNRRLSALTDSIGFGAKNLPGTLKKAQSSSTIKSWHDKSKHSRSLSRQASIPVMNSSHSSNTQAAPDADESPKSRRKPPKLDFTSIAPPIRVTEMGTIHNGIPSASVKTPSTTPYSAASHRQSDLRGMFKRRTKDSFRSFMTDSTPQSAVEGRRMTSHSSENRLSTLYNHYEQMTFRDAMDEPEFMSGAADQKDPAGGQGEKEWREPAARRNLDWLHKPLNESNEPQPMAHSEYSSSPGDGARSVSSRHTRTSRASRQTDSGIIQEADFYDKSVLLLSSDSEQEEENDDAKASTRDHLPLPMRPLPEAPGHGQTRPSRARQVSGRESGGLPGKKTSFASSNVYIATPGAERKRMSPSPSRLNPPVRDGSRASSPKPSVGSTNSTGSAMTSQNGYGAEDSHLTTVLPARRPSQAELDRQKALAQLTRGSGSSLRRESVATSSGQPDHEPVPPSPTSVNRYLRSARSSVDDSASQGCVMTLTRQEEMLISALRKKTQAMREKSQRASSSNSQSDAVPTRRHVSNPSQVQVVTDSMLDFDFPAPPTHSTKSRQSQASSFMSTPITEHPDGEDDNYRAPSRLTADTGSERASFVSSIRGPEDFAEPEDVLVYLDQGKHSSGQWSQVGSDGQPVEEAALSSGFQSVPWDYPEEKRPSKPKGRVSLRHQTQADCMSPSKLTRLSEDGNEDVPRPDSPISNETFPQPQQPRRAAMNTARLSAVGFVRRDPELGWWGDDD